MPRFRRAWTSSTLVRIGIALGLVSALGLTVVVAATVFADRSTGKAAAINAAGALRMQSFALATRIADRQGDPALRRAQVSNAVAAFEARLAGTPLAQAVDHADAPVRADFDAVVRRWREGIRPLADAAVDDAAARAAFLDQVTGFVAQIDALVGAVERDLEARIRSLRLALGAGFFLMLMLFGAILLLLRIEVFQPIARLVEAARRVRAGDFEVRAQATGADEIGQLGQSFNMMVQALAQLTGSLERQVAERTEELARRNRSLALLYDATRTLSEGAAGRDACLRVLTSMQALLGFESGAVYVKPPGASAATLLVAVGDAPQSSDKRGETCEESDAVAHGQVRVLIDAGAGLERRRVVAPLLDGGCWYGKLELGLAPGRALEQWQLDLAETIGRHLGAALAAALRHEEHRRLGVLEERGAIARELHDSIAQALAYTQIQVTRLAATLRQQGYGANAQQVLDELREGLGHAYRQLRELLATFRLQVNAQGLGPSLRETIADFQRRCGIATTLDDRLQGVTLDINQQVHVLQIVREALTNVEHHAHAHHVQVRLLRRGERGIEVSIGDDGVGIDVVASPAGHFGLAIMRDRAALLDGELEISRRAPPTRGTRVVLRFDAPPDTERAAAAPALMAS